MAIITVHGIFDLSESPPSKVGDAYRIRNVSWCGSDNVTVYAIKFPDYTVKHLGIETDMVGAIAAWNTYSYSVCPGDGDWTHPHDIGDMLYLEDSGYSIACSRMCMGNMVHDAMDKAIARTAQAKDSTDFSDIYAAVLSGLLSVNPEDLGNSDIDDAGACEICGDTDIAKESCDCGKRGCAGSCVRLRPDGVYRCTKCAKEYCPECGSLTTNDDDIPKCSRCGDVLCACNTFWGYNGMCHSCNGMRGDGW